MKVWMRNTYLAEFIPYYHIFVVNNHTLVVAILKPWCDKLKLAHKFPLFLELLYVRMMKMMYIGKIHILLHFVKQLLAVFGTLFPVTGYFLLSSAATSLNVVVLKLLSPAEAWWAARKWMRSAVWSVGHSVFDFCCCFCFPLVTKEWVCVAWDGLTMGSSRENA